jgi:poly-gamma-glutamate synthesis protein (capsule biosynthesis protein)
MDAQTTLNVALTGDSMITRHALVSEDEATRKLVSLVRDADVAFTNLEVLPNNFKGHPAGGHGGTHLAAPDWVVDDLIAAGFDLYGTATNHALDFHVDGLLAMIEVLEQKGIAFAGVGRNLAEARMPVYVEKSGGVVAMISVLSTFSTGEEASEQRPDFVGRPGVNPLRFETTYTVTPDEMRTLRSIAEKLGLERRRLETIQLGFAFPPDDPSIFPFLGGRFREGERTEMHTKPSEKDAQAIARWIHEARNRADVIMLSMHGHEDGGSAETPAEFMPVFAHRMLDEGADMIVGHGPHQLRGMEIYQGKPIFYSLGNFIAQNDLVYKVPAEAYDRFRVPQTETPSAVFIGRAEGGKKGFPSDPRYWESVVPICHIEQGRYAAIEIYPIVLGHNDPAHRRGRPKLAQGDEATRVLQRFAKLSEPFGTRMRIEGGRAIVEIEA